ncbi:MAG: hypothetical protein JEZ14_24310 [Marinilabiliaceae bacterium]|nr:hypothetical protein [Marinilabiliaceae bacterium]
MKILKVLLLAFISFSSLQQIHACGGWEDYDTYYRLFNPGYMVPGNEFGPITYSDEPWSNINSWFSFAAQHEDNITCWKHYFPVSFPEKAIKDFIYQSSEDELLAALNNGTTGTNEVLNWSRNNDRKVLEYLIFAKQCEGPCNPEQSYYWQEEEETDPAIIQNLITKGKSFYTKCNNLFLKERYAFQLVKLMRHGEQYDQCLAFWESAFPASPQSMMDYWALDHIAGIQLQQGQETDGWKKFLEVFQNCPSKRYSAYYSIKIQSDEQWEALLNACDNDQQKETMYFMRASHLGSLALADIQSIYAINPNSVYLPALISREINKMESILLQNSAEENVYYQLYFNQNNINEELTTYVSEFQQFMNQVLADNTITNADFWRISNAFTCFLIQQPDEAHQHLAALSNSVSKDFASQVTIIENLLLLTDADKTPVQRQNELAENWIVEVKDFAFLFMSHPDNQLPFPLNQDERMYQLRNHLNTAKLEALVDLTENYEQLSWFANYILENHYLHTSNEEGQALNLDILNEMLGTAYLADDKTERAIAAFSRLSDGFKASNENFNLGFNPFNYLVNDINRSSLNPTSYSKLKFAQTLHAIRQTIDAGTATAMDYYLLGNASYNTTYFGYVWNAKAYYRSGSCYTGVFDCSMAHNYFLQAANATDDREMQAKCYYLAAKANQNLYLRDYTNSEWFWKVSIEEDELRSKGYRAEFETLKEDYSDTKFYSRIIEECKYFDFYVN